MVKKTVSNVGIPNFILNSNKVIIKNFLQHVFDDEGSVTESVNKAKHIKLELSVDVTNRIKNTKPLLLIDICRLLKIMRVNFRGPYFSRKHVCKDKSIKHMWYIYIGNINNLILFSKKINFSSVIKSRKLKEAITKINKNIEFKRKPRKDMLQKVYKIYNKYGNISTRLLCTKYKLPLSRVSSWLTRLENEGIIIKTSNHKTSRIYILK